MRLSIFAAIVFTVVWLAGCTPAKDKLYGEYEAENKEGKATLILRKDMTYEQTVITKGQTFRISGVWDYESDGHVSLPRAYDIDEHHINVQVWAEALSAAQGFPWKVHLVIDPDNDFYY